jgi:S-adenosylmethionine hydrolase
MIVILTDFSESEYLGVMKGVIHSINKRASLVDLYNSVTVENIKEGAWILFAGYRYFPKGSVFLCVVDPGVGSKRQCIAIKTKDYYFVGPDNGLMYPAAMENRILGVRKLSAKGASKTFHGRDVLAHAAAMLEKGESFEKLGEKAGIREKFMFYRKKREGEIVRVDFFGNIVTNLDPLQKNTVYTVKFRGKIKLLEYYQTYEQAPEGELFLITGSAGTLEISVKNGKASDKVRLKPGDRIEIY